MNTAAATAAASAAAPAAAGTHRRVVLMPDADRSDELVRRYRLARLRLEPRDRADPFAHLRRSYD